MARMVRDGDDIANKNAMTLMKLELASFLHHERKIMCF